MKLVVIFGMNEGMMAGMGAKVLGDDSRMGPE